MNGPDDHSLDPSMSLKKGGGGKGIWIVIVAVVVVAGGAAAFMTMHHNELGKNPAAVISQFADVEKLEVGRFWQCVLGENFDINQVQDNLTLGRRIEGAF